MDEILIFDNRSFLLHLWNTFQETYDLYEIFFSKTKTKNRNFVMILYMLSISFDFFLNAFFYSDNLIEIRNENGVKNKFDKETWLYVIQNELTKAIISFIISNILVWIVELIVEIPESYLRKYNEDLLSGDPLFIKSSCIWIENMMKIRYNFAIFITICCHLMSWYFITAFCSVYNDSSSAWLLGSLLSLIINEVISIGLIITHSVIRITTRKFPNKMNRFFYKAAIYFL